jgi:methylenetetrahydrofolate reductase (NADPH)
MEQAGIEYACEQIRDLAAQGVAGIHLYTMNKPLQAKQILQQSGLIS